MRVGADRVGERLPTVFGGRALRRYPEFKPPRLEHPGHPPVSGYTGWWDASDTSTLTLDSAGGRVTAWADLSASAFNATEETSVDPGASVVIPNQHHGRGVIMGRDQFAFSMGLSGQDRTQSVFFCGCVFTFSSPRALIGASANNGRLFRVESTGRLACLKRNVAALATTSAAMTVTAGTPFVAGLVLNTTTIDIYFNRVTPENFSESTTFATATGSFIGGGDTNIAQRVPGYVCEVVAYDSTLSSGNALLIVDYLMAKWDIG